MSKKVEMKKYTVEIPVNVALRFRVVSDNAENAINMVKESRPCIGFYGNSISVHDGLYYTENLESDVLPYYNQGFKNPELPCGYKWNETEIVRSDFHSTIDDNYDGNLGWYEYDNLSCTSNGSITYYIPDED